MDVVDDIEKLFRSEIRFIEISYARPIPNCKMELEALVMVTQSRYHWKAEMGTDVL